MDNPESSVQEVIQGDDKSKWIADTSNHDMKLFTEIELERITSNYETILGRGGFGEVFQGVLEDGSMVAVKRLIRSVEQNFEKELKVHREMNHKNVVRLIGCCIEEKAFTMVTEYIPKGNLSDALHKDKIPISLDTRLTIAIECAEALSYMHSQMDTRVIHGDVKPANILLDERLGVKVSDFGISRLVNTENTLYTVNVVGSIGYIDPLFHMYGRVSAKNDVYSFGVVLLELLTRKKPRTGDGEMGLVATFTQALAKGGRRRLRELLDPEIATSRSEARTAEEIVKLAAKCLTLDHKKRPEMLEVAKLLGELREVPYHRRQGLFSRRGKHQQTTQVEICAEEPSSSRQSSTTASSNREPPEDKCKVPTQRQAGLSFPWFRRGKKKQMTTPAQTCDSWSGSTVVPSCSSLAGRGRPEDALLDESGQLLGKGTVGTTYKVLVSDGSAIAVKRLDDGVDLTEAEFEQRMAAIGAAEECVNVLPLLGYHFTEQEKFVSYLCMPMGSLAKALHGDGATNRETMDWYQRLCILSKVVDAVESIHSLGPSSCHGNIKSSNVLLDESHAARLSENGLGTLGLSLNAAACGYRAPEVTHHRFVSQKADVYSFGILMLELFTRKAPVNGARPSEEGGVDLLQLVSSVIRVTQVLDTELLIPDEEVEHIILQLLQIAIECCSHNANLRPSMSDVRALLHYLLQKTMLYAATL